VVGNRKKELAGAQQEVQRFTAALAVLRKLKFKRAAVPELRLESGLVSRKRRDGLATRGPFGKEYPLDPHFLVGGVVSAKVFVLKDFSVENGNTVHAATPAAAGPSSGAPDRR
jgi:hypothetical protein